MGIQSAAAQRVGVPGVTTTYVTGTLTSHGRAPGRLAAVISRRARRSGQCRRAPWLQASVWIAYGAGAVFAGAAHLWWPTVALPPVLAGGAGGIRWGPAALLLPIAIVVAVILIAALAYRRRDTQA